MPRFLKALLLLLAFTLAGSTVMAQSIPIVTVSGRLAQGQLRVFTKDTLYQIAGRYIVAGQLVVEPGTTIEFLPNGSLIDSVGGKIIADGLQDAIWNRDTTGLPPGDRFCDLGYLVGNVNISGDPEVTAPGPNWTAYVPYVLFYYANRMDRCATDPNRRNQPYARDVRRAPITFRGRPVNRFSREWGHIVILPGADSAIFRNCRFVNFRKDTQVVNTTSFYTPSSAAGYTPAQINAGFKLNREMQLVTTGGGGAITTFSSKTWLLDCVFDSNFARYHGGAVQFLEAPYDSTVFQYPACGTNPPLYNNGTPTVIAAARSFYRRDPGLATDTEYPVGNPENLYDIYSTTPGSAPGAGGVATPFGVIPGLQVTVPTVGATGIQYRQGYDDGRMSVNNGRVRRLTFRDNRVVLSNTVENVNGYRDTTDNAAVKPTAFVYDCNPNAPSFSNGRLLTAPSLAKNDAYGGAAYVSGRRFMTVYWGGGSAIRFNGDLPYFDPTFIDRRDTILCERNYAVNYQDTTTVFVNQLGLNNTNQTYITFRSGGARGGAFYIGDSTSMVFEHSRFQANWTATPNVDERDYVNRSAWSQGGGIYMGPTSPELTMRDNILLRDNYSGQGGAIYVAAVRDPFTDAFISPNLLGDSVRVLHNRAEYDGGAIFTRRNPLIAALYLTRIDSTTPGFPLVDHRILFDSNSAGLSGGAITIDHWNRQGVNVTPQASRSQVRRVLFTNNVAGDSSTLDINRLVKLYNPVINPIAPTNQWGVTTAIDTFRFPMGTLSGDRIGGGAIWSMLGNVNLFSAVEFRSNTAVGGNGGAVGSVTPVRSNRYFIADDDTAVDANGLPIPFDAGMMPEDQRELTRFIRNRAIQDTITGLNNPNPGSLRPTPLDPNRNFSGLGGALYLNDRQSPVPGPGIARVDSVINHRVRMQQNTAWSGAAVYSDNYELRVVFNKSLITGNRALSDTGRKTDTIDNYITSPEASRIAGAVLYGEIEGPLPSTSYHTNANAIYDNDARYLVRLPDAPAGAVGNGQSGTDTLRGNFWGRTEAPVTTVLPSGVLQNTFYIQGAGCTLPLKDTGVINQQGPFESPRRIGDAVNKPSYVYRPIPIYTIPDTLLMEGRIYDIFDKGVDIKAADYKDPRLAPIEDFAVGIPVRLRPFPTGFYAGSVVRRLTRDPQLAEQDTALYGVLQREFRGPHPIGYPLFLESNADYTFNRDSANDDAYALNYTVFFVINVETGDIVRANLKQVREGNPVMRERIEFVADSINRDPVNRRTREDRAGFSIGELYRLSPRYYFETPGEIPATITTLEDSLDYARMRAAEYEDSVALAGRRHGGFTGQVAGDARELGGPGFAYVNRDLNGNPAPVRFADIYSGERYHALPVLQGDRIWVISRTELWNMEDSLLTVIDESRATGIQFVIDNANNTVEPPIIFGQRDSLENRTPAELRNSRFLVEDRNYISDRTGVDTSDIFEVTANDLNGFFDPRSLFFPDRYTALRYEWQPMYEAPGQPPVPVEYGVAGADSVRLSSWLHADTVFPAAQAANPRARRDSTRGFLRFWGTPHNPDVVPGGELLRIRVSNYPPGIQTIDSLRALADSLRPSADTIAHYIFLYPPYYNCQVYDPVTARYLQQDTVNGGSAATTEYRLRIFVQDTPPVVESEINPCGRQGLMVANLTNYLRFDYDLNTDDEREDTSVIGEGWDFRYGRTTYGFRFTDISYIGNGDSIGTDDAADIRPIWMRDQYLRDTTSPYWSPTNLDNGARFQRAGIVRVRIDSATAIGLLRNNAIANVPFNLDSIYTVVVNDGHQGMRNRDRRVVVNVAPQLQPVANLTPLPRAKEDFDYNPQLLDSSRGVRAHDLNVGQRVRYTLIYANDALNPAEYQTGGIVQDSVGTQTNTATTAYVRRDRCYAEAGLWYAPKSTPSWLKVNPVSGLLYGTPGLNDAPHTFQDNGPDTVTVVAEDEFGLTDLRTYILEVDSTNHRPRLFGRPPVFCVNNGQQYTDTVCVTDRDLGRLRSTERVDITVLQPAGFTVTPNSIQGPGEDTVCMQVHTDRVNLPPGRHRIILEARDLAGNRDTINYEITVGDSLIFGMYIRTRNTRREPNGNLDSTYAFQDLFFGLAQNATTGEERGGLGNLDSLHCEYELPPVPPLDVFDARWTIVTTQGILRNIFPLTPSPDQGTKVAWKGTFQPGDQNNGSPNYPVVFTWSTADAYKCPRTIYFEDQLFNDSTGQGLLRVNMKTGAYTAGSGIQVRATGTAPNQIITVEIYNTTIDGFKIIYDLLAEVKPTITVGGYTLSSNVPNPVTSTTEITYSAPERSEVALEIFNSTGVLVRTLVSGEVEQGSHSVTWDATNDKGEALPSGAYTYRLRAGSVVITKSMVLVK